MSVITNKWNDGSGDSINIESPSFQGNQTIKISSPVQKGTSKRSMRFIGKCKKDSSKQVILTVEQEASTYTYDLTLNSDNTEIAAKGGTTTITAVLKTYRNGNLVSTDNVTPVLSGSATGFSISGTTVSASNRTTVVGTERSITVTGKFSGTFDGQEVSATVVVKQEANSQSLREITYRCTSSNPYTGQNTVKANGGIVWVYTFAIYDYTSGSTSESNVSDECTFGNVTFGTWDSEKHTWICPTAGTTIYSEDRGASIQVKWGSQSTVYYLYQQANLLTWNNPVITYAYSDIAASGGTVTPSLSITQSGNYTSGSTASNTTIGSKSFSGTGVNTSTGAYTASSLGTTVKARTKVGQVTVTCTGEGGVTAKKTANIYQEANAVIDNNYDEHLSSYGTPEMVITSNLITAAGGTARAAGVVRNTYTHYHLYTSGSTVPYTRTKDGVYKIEMISNGNNRFSMDDTYLITHSSMGANVTTDTAKFRCYNESDRTKYVDDSISVSNRIESYNYGSWNISISADPICIQATGGTSTITSSCTRSKTPVYTSGSTGTATTESATTTLALTTNPGGFTLNGNKLTAANNLIGPKTATVTASYSGATSKSVSVTQAAGRDGIGYMQIEGNGVDHYIFQVGRTPNTRSNDVQTLSEEPVEVAVETKSESLFAKIKRIITNLN